MPDWLGLATWRHWRWLLPAAGFCAGVASFVLVERAEWLAQWITGVLLLGWALLLAEAPLRRLIQRLTGLDLPPVLLRYGTQALHQEALFFCIPFFLIATDWTSAQVLFTGLLFVLAVVSITDPLYFGVVGRHPWLLLGLHAFVIFTALLTALPIVLLLDTAQSLLIAAAAMSLTAVPSLVWRLPLNGWRAWTAALLLAPALGMTAWWGRAAIPPATLGLTEAYITHELDRTGRVGEPMEAVRSAADLRAKGLFAFTAVRAPRGLHEAIYHVWIHEGREVDRIRLQIDGGRVEGYRSWSHKRAFEGDPSGRWEVRLETAGGQQIGRLAFRVLI